MLVANKCDKSAGDLSEIVQRAVTRVREVLSDWQSNRGIPGQVGNPIPTLNLLLLPSLVSCDDAFGLSDLIERIAGEGGTSISIPPAWDLALAVVDALRDKEEPLMSAREHLGLCSIAVSSRHMPELFMSRRALSQLWGDILEHLRDSSELRTAAQLAAVTNADSALKGALWIR